MKFILLLLFISQVQLNDQEKHFINIVKRDVYTSSPQNFNYYTKTYEIGQNIILNTPNFTWIDSLLSINQSKSSVREHTTWLIQQISSDQPKEIARYDSIQQQFILNSHENSSYIINSTTGHLTLINTNLLYTEISMHSQTGLSEDDDILHDIYRFIRLSTNSINCTTNMTVNIDESIEIECTIEYEYFKNNDLKPKINLRFYRKENNSIYIPIDEIYLNKIEDYPIDNNKTINWKRSIIYKIKSININQEYICIIIPDYIENQNNNNQICRTRISIPNNQSSTMIITRLNQIPIDLIDILIIIFIIFSILLFIISFILCFIARQYHKKRTIQIKPENKILKLPINNNENQSEIILSEHKPGCPKYLPSNDFFPHPTIDQIKKIILPDIPENADLFPDQTSIHFYIPSKNTNLSLKRYDSSLIEKDQNSN